MIASGHIVSLSDLYASTDASTAATRIRFYAESNDYELSDAIDTDAAARQINGIEVSLTFYLSMVPNLPSREIPFDTAIDVTLKDRCVNGASLFDAAERLIEDFPEHSESILRSARMSSVFATSCLRSLAEDDRLGPVPLELGPTVGDGQRRYQLGREIGRGSYGRVFEAIDLHIGSGSEAACAIKVLDLPTGHSPDSTWTEARKARAVRHPNVVTVHDYGETDDGRAFVVMELIDGVPMASLDHNAIALLSPERFVRVATELLSALQAVHQVGILHGDIKPANILLDRSASSDIGRVALADFGVARRDTTGPREATRDPSAFGTPLYLAPELTATGRALPTIASDLYSAGQTLRSLIGLLPMAHGSKPQPATFVDNRLKAILDRACATAPEGRHSSSLSLLDDLERWRTHRPVAWLDTSPVRQTKLLVRRRPYAVALGAAATLMAGLALAAGLARAQFQALESARAEAESRVKGIVELDDPDLRSYNPWRDWLTTTALLDRLRTTNDFLVIDPDAEIDAQIRRIDAHLLQIGAEPETLEYKLMQANLVLLHLIDRGYRSETQAFLDDCSGWFQTALEPDDPIHTTFGLMQHCLAIKRAIDTSLAATGTLPAPETLKPHHDYLVEWLSDQTNAFADPIEREQLSDPVFRLVCRNLALTASPKLLDEPQILAALLNRTE
jgi:serine/threonine protein kinase